MQDREQTHDVLILGGGPAGSATALALKRCDPALRIALVEKTDYSAIRIGETLLPTARDLLVELGVWDAFLATSPMKSFGTRAAWGGPELYENEFIFLPHGHGWHLDRRDFDALLSAEASRAGVELILNCTACGQPQPGQQWRLTIRNGENRIRTIQTRFVVDATGRLSWFASSQGVRSFVYDQLAGAFVFFHFGSMQIPADTYTAVEACESGWWYTAMLPEHRMVAALVTDADQLRRLRWRRFKEWSSLAARSHHTAKRIAGAIPLEQPMLYSASSRRLETSTGDGWLAVGDAASTFDPLSSQGIVKSLRAGVYAAHAICRYLRGQTDALTKYAAALTREYRNYLDARAAYYRLEQRWSSAPFWRRRQEIITLHPEQMLQSRKTRAIRSATRLSQSDLRTLAEICATPCTASEVVRQFHNRTHHAHIDRHIVLALQQLAEEGALAAGATPVPENYNKKVS